MLICKTGYPNGQGGVLIGLIETDLENLENDDCIEFRVSVMGFGNLPVFISQIDKGGQVTVPVNHAPRPIVIGLDDSDRDVLRSEQGSLDGMMLMLPYKIVYGANDERLSQIVSRLMMYEKLKIFLQGDQLKYQLPIGDMIQPSEN